MIVGFLIISILCILFACSAYELMRMCEYYKTQYECLRERMKNNTIDILNETAAEQENKIEEISATDEKLNSSSIKFSTKKLDKKIKKSNNVSKK